MLERIKHIFSAILEGVQDARRYEAEKYLLKSKDISDLEVREKELKRKGML